MCYIQSLENNVILGPKITLFSVIFASVFTLFSFYDPIVVFFPWFGGRRFLVYVTQGYAADAYQSFRKPQLRHKLLAFLGGEHFPFPVDPAGAQAYGVGGVHHIAEDKGAVADGIAPLFQRRAEDEHDGRRVVIRIAFAVHYRRVHPDELSDYLRVLHGHDPGILVAHAGGRVGSGLKHGLQLFVCDLFLFETADAAAFAQGFQYLVVHNCSSMVKYLVMNMVAI